jgi:hypothetical protein
LGDNAMLEAAQVLFHGTLLERFMGARREALLAKFGLSGPRIFSRVILGGGTLINEGYLDIVRRGLDLGIPMLTLGTGAGSAGFGGGTERLSPRWRDVLVRFKRVGVRGPQTLELLSSIGVKDAEIVGDLALALTPDRSLLRETATCFLLNVAAPKATDPTFATAEVFRGFVEASIRLMALGLKPIPLAFSEDDVEPLKTVMVQAGITERVLKPRSAADFFKIASEARLCLGVRLHSAVLSACAGVPSLCVAYRSKGRDYALSMRLGDWMVEPDFKGLAARAEHLAADAVSIGAKVHTAALGWRESLRRYVASA